MAKKAKGGNLIGSWAFLIGVIIALVYGFLGSISATMGIVLVAIGLIVGLLNVTDEEVAPFLMSGAVLVIVSSMGKDELSVIAWTKNIVSALLLIFVPATIVVAIKNVFTLARR